MAAVIAQIVLLVVVHVLAPTYVTHMGMYNAPTVQHANVQTNAPTVQLQRTNCATYQLSQRLGKMYPVTYLYCSPRRIGT